MARSDWRRPSLEPLAEGVRRIALKVSYDGSAFCGWQFQNNGISVQQTLESALAEMLGFPVSIYGSGRTDAGVHALGQVCHFDIRSTVPVRAFKPRLNSLLPFSVRVMEAKEMDDSFHCRYTAMARRYCYLVKARGDITPFDAGRVYPVRSLPSLELLNGYASVLKGTHDFTTFCSAKDECESKFRDIYESYWSRETDTWGAVRYRYTICGNAFLYHMVRSLTGSMLEYAHKGVSVKRFKEMLEAKERSLAGITAPGCGLYLEYISYDPEEYLWFEEIYDAARS